MPHGVQSQERIVDALSGFGFSESQASVYAVLLRLGRCSVRDLASATGFSRITIQGILDKFEGDHIVCGVYEGKRERMYSPANIRGLKSLLDGQIDKLEQQRDAIASLFAEATEADRKAPRGFGVHALRGVRGMEFLRDDILQCNADISIFGDVSACPLTTTQTFHGCTFQRSCRHTSRCDFSCSIRCMRGISCKH